MAKTHLQNYLGEVKKKLSVNRIFPRITQEEIDHNTEMMSADDEDAVNMFLAGIITGLDLADILNGENVLPFRKC